jgi:hypothetical protein
VVSVAVPGVAEASVRVRDPTVKALETYDIGARRSGSGGRREGRWDHTPRIMVFMRFHYARQYMRNTHVSGHRTGRSVPC